MAVVRPADLKYYTKTRDFTDVHVLGLRAAYEHSGGPGAGAKATTAAVGDCLVTTRWLGFHRVWQGSGEVFDTVDLFLPDMQLRTQARSLPGLAYGWLLLGGLHLLLDRRRAHALAC